MTKTEYLFSEKFALAGLKDAKIMYRAWNAQLRQLAALIQPRSVDTLAPTWGFSHHKTAPDTLGLDQTESACEEMNRL